MEEANEEAEHEGWCDTELSGNEQTRKEKTEASETLYAKTDQIKASIAKSGRGDHRASAWVAELDATTLRQEEKNIEPETRLAIPRSKKNEEANA
eukprot:16449221-Heterocapsa_arctica.AAC.1